MCSLAARALWFEMICTMGEAEPYGHYIIGNRHVSEADFALIAIDCSATKAEVKRCLLELKEAGVYSVSDDGTIFSRRMVRDGEKSRTLRENGKLGGSPLLKSLDKQKVNQNGDEPLKPQIPDTRIPDSSDRSKDLSAERRPKKEPDTTWVAPLREAIKAIAGVKIRDLSIDQRLLLGRYFAWRFAGYTKTESKNHKAGAKYAIAFAQMADSKLYADLSVRQYVDEAVVYQERIAKGIPFHEPFAIRAVAEPVSA